MTIFRMEKLQTVDLTTTATKQRHQSEQKSKWTNNKQQTTREVLQFHLIMISSCW